MPLSVRKSQGMANVMIPNPNTDFTGCRVGSSLSPKSKVMESGIFLPFHVTLNCSGDRITQPA